MKSLLLPPLIALLAMGCASTPELGNGISRIHVHPGPEDIDILQVDGRPHILVSSTSRREKLGDGVFSIIDPRDDSVRELSFTRNEKIGIEAFKPHGIHVFRKPDDPDTQHILAVSHPDSGDELLLFAYRDGALKLTDRIALDWHKRPMHDVANDVTVLDDGRYFVSLANKGKVGRIDPATRELEVLRGPCFANGLIQHGEELLVASAFWGEIVSIDPDAEDPKPETLLRTGGAPDNFTRAGEDRYLITAHAGPIYFVLHALCPGFPAPTRVFEIRMNETEKLRELLLDGRERFPIEAGSTALLLDEHLYISQVFEPFILKVAPHRIESVVP